MSGCDWNGQHFSVFFTIVVGGKFMLPDWRGVVPEDVGGARLPHLPVGQNLEQFSSLSGAMKKVEKGRYTGKLEVLTRLERVYLLWEEGELVAAFLASRLAGRPVFGDKVFDFLSRSKRRGAILRVVFLHYNLDELHHVLSKVPESIVSQKVKTRYERLKGFLEKTDRNTRKIIELLTFSDITPSITVLRAVCLSPFFTGLTSSEFESSLSKIEREGIISKNTGRDMCLMSQSTKSMLRHLYVKHLDEKNLRNIAEQNPEARHLVELLIEHGGALPCDHLKDIYKNHEEPYQWLRIGETLSNEGVIIRSLDPHGVLHYTIPYPLLDLAKKTILETKKEETEKKPSREELLRTYHIVEPREEEIEKMLEELYKREEHDITEALIEMLQKPDTRMRRVASATLENLRDPRAVEALVEALHDSDPGVRSSSARAL
ncbi:MAG: hypothetical protein DRO11_03915, partial [Methanobacteriota archaeon]